MTTQLRVRLPMLERLHAGSTVQWVQLRRGELHAQGSDTLAVLGQRHPQAALLACLDPQDLIMLELPLPPLSGRRLQAAIQGEVEAMLLDDLQDVALGHGRQAADRTVAVAWLGQQAIVQAQQVIAGCGLHLQGLYPTPLLLPWQPGSATLQASGEHLLVRSGLDRGFVHWCGGRDRGAVLLALKARLQQCGVQQVQWLGDVPPDWPHDLPASALPEQAHACGPLPGWSLPLPGRRQVAPRLAIALAVAAVLLAAVGLQLQVMRWRTAGEALQQHTARQLAAQFPEITQVVDPVVQARRALAVPPAPAPLPAVQQQVATVLQAIPALAGQVRSVGYQPDALTLDLDDAARALADDPQRLEQWQQATQAHGLQLRRNEDGLLRITGASR